ncbi:MAG: response regulator [Candidatus Cloacimonetes bacterium HGW-Cloacimonetes-1]|jgi:CheY-like chemotaxis protein|nr:MAG: response regulator [Candidatus Cloacimonetes bacterium HGW-Cloacimonetes-1]
MTPKIMIVDDEQSIRDIISEFLTEAGYAVAIAVDGMDALEKVAYEKYDLYIIDVYMPRMDGLELIVKLKEIQPLAVIVVTTGFSSVDVAIKAIRSGAYHYLTKPIRTEELLKVVKAGLKHSVDLIELTTPSSESAASRSEKLNEMLLLRGFTHEQMIGFRGLGTLTDYAVGETIPLDEATGSLIFVENGILNVIHNGSVIDALKEGDTWGEETFIIPSAIFTTLKAQTLVQVRHFPRKKIWEFFNYNDETLTKRYMINLIQCQYMKWRRSMYRIGLYSGFPSDTYVS